MRQLNRNAIFWQRRSSKKTFLVLLICRDVEIVASAEVGFNA